MCVSSYLNNSMWYNLPQRLLCDGIDAFSCGLGCYGELFMQFRGDTQIKSTRIMAAWRNAFFLANFEKYMQ